MIEDAKLIQDVTKQTVVALAGGVGGAKLAHGLASVLSTNSFTVIVNTADDFDHLGLRICPDLDTVVYTLANRENPATGWGIADDTRVTLDALARYGEDPWFLVGDRDFATHIFRTLKLSEGNTLSDVTHLLVTASGIESTVLPMTNDRVATVVDTPSGRLAFQDYFVARRQADDVLGVEFDGVTGAIPAPGVVDAIRTAAMVIICPSNPIVSVGPILSVPGIREALSDMAGLKVAVSPIVGGKALKGPADRMLRTLGHEVSALGVARMYQGLIDWMVIDTVDAELAPEIAKLGMQTLVTDTIMSNPAKRACLAGEIMRIELPRS